MSRSVDELEELLGNVPWELFEGRYTGDIFIKLDKTLLGFFMRIGTYLKRPVQVIMADGNYIRIRSADKYAECGLLSLDPDKPEDCLYPEHYQYESGIPNKPLWLPFAPYVMATGQFPYTNVISSSVLLGNFTTSNTSIAPAYSNALQGLQTVGLFTAGAQPNQGLGHSSGWFSKIFGGITP